MSAISGPRLEAIEKKLIDWYVHKRQMLIQALEEDYPFGTVKLSPVEQYLKFETMNADDWIQMIGSLQDRYRGMPNQYELVNKDLQAYVHKMLSLTGQVQPEGDIYE